MRPGIMESAGDSSNTYLFNSMGARSSLGAVREVVCGNRVKRDKEKREKSKQRTLRLVSVRYAEMRDDTGIFICGWVGASRTLWIW